jgi:ligand-binding SRPBCC domain-containing protein
MPVILLETFISAPVQDCFDAARNLDLHLGSMEHTGEKAVAGKLSGLAESGDVITWEAVHFGVRQRLTVEIGKMNPPYFFEDFMVKGAFEEMHHSHYFDLVPGGTRMRDVFQFRAPFGLLGRMAEGLFLIRYMRNLLLTRNQFLKQTLEC